MLIDLLRSCCYSFLLHLQRKVHYFKYISYVNMNFGCYGCSKHPKKIQKHPKNIQKHPKNIRKTSEKHPKTSEKDPRKIRKKNAKYIRKHPKKIQKTSENIQKRSEMTRKTSEKDLKQNYGMFLGCVVPFCIVFNTYVASYSIISLFYLFCYFT